MTAEASNGSLMEVRGLEVQFKTRGATAKAVDGVSLEWRRR